MSVQRLYFSTFLFLSLLFGCQVKNKPSQNMTFYIGTYTHKEGHVDGKGDGIYRMTFDPDSLEFRVTDTIRGMTNPSFLALTPDHQLLYAVNERNPGPDGMGLFEEYDLRPGSFGHRIASISTFEYAPCHVSLDREARLAVVCNYSGGKLCAFTLPMDQQTTQQVMQLPSTPKANPRQEGAHLHSSVFSPDNRFVYVADLGTDHIMIYRYNREQRKLIAAEQPYFQMPDGSGPRHMAFAQDGKTLYALNELNNTVAVLRVGENGSLELLQTLSTLPDNYTGHNYTADLHLSKDGKHLYASNRGHNSIAVFQVSADNHLKSLGFVDTHGKTPRNFHLTNDGNWMLVANQDTGNIALFDLQKGELPVFVKSVEVATPVCIVE